MQEREGGLFRVCFTDGAGQGVDVCVLQGWLIGIGFFSHEWRSRAFDDVL
jgi:hypothetical protein